MIISCVTPYYAIKLRVGLCGWGSLGKTQLLVHSHRCRSLPAALCASLPSHFSQYRFLSSLKTFRRAVGVHAASYSTGNGVYSCTHTSRSHAVATDFLSTPTCCSTRLTGLWFHLVQTRAKFNVTDSLSINLLCHEFSPRLTR